MESLPEYQEILGVKKLLLFFIFNKITFNTFMNDKQILVVHYIEEESTILWLM